MSVFMFFLPPKKTINILWLNLRGPNGAALYKFHIPTLVYSGSNSALSYPHSFSKVAKKADNFFFLCIQRNTFIHKETLNTHTVQQGLGNLAF